MWSVVTPVPAGTHEFKFVVDGEWKHSTRHPTVGEDEETMNNIRVIRGPPKNKQNTARFSQERNKEAGMAAPKQKKCCVVRTSKLQLFTPVVLAHHCYICANSIPNSNTLSLSTMYLLSPVLCSVMSSLRSLVCERDRPTLTLCAS